MIHKARVGRSKQIEIKECGERDVLCFKDGEIRNEKQ